MIYARLNRRIKATIVDLLILTGPIVFILYKKIPVIAIVFFIILYFSFFESCGLKGTIGKRILGIKVESINERKLRFSEAFLRNSLKVFISLNFLFLGFTISTFTKYKQAYHDIFVNSVVINRKAKLKLNSRISNSIEIYNTKILFKILTLNLTLISLVFVLGFFIVNSNMLMEVSIKNEIQMVFFSFIIIMSTIGFYYRMKWSYWTSLISLSLVSIRIFVFITENFNNIRNILLLNIFSFEVIVVVTLFFLLKKDIFLKFKFKLLERGKFRQIILILLFFAVIIVFNIN